MSNMDRQLTITVVVKDPEQAKQIWDKHMSRELLAGCVVTGIGDGDALNDLIQLENYVEYLQEEIANGNHNPPTFETWKASFK